MKKFKYDRVKFILLFQKSIKNLSLEEQKDLRKFFLNNKKSVKIPR